MLLYLIAAAAFWVLGRAFGLDARRMMIVILSSYVTIVLLLIVLPMDHPFKLALGGTVAPWLLVGGGIGLIALYRWGLGRLRSQISQQQTLDPVAENVPNDKFSSTELERYARHIVLREIGGVGQKKIKKAKVLVIGAGGLGAPVLQYLGAAGLGTLGVIDHDVVDNSNLQRQIIHRDDDIGMPKVFSAKNAVEAQNPYVTVVPYNRRLTADIAEELFADYDIIVDGSDNFECRYVANKAAVALGKPLVSGALSQWEGQVTIFDPKQGTPCYKCLFPTEPPAGIAPSCAEAGVFAPLPGVIGSMIAAEVLKLITHSGEPLRSNMLIYDSLYSETRKFAIGPRQGCDVCAATQVQEGN